MNMPNLLGFFLVLLWGCGSASASFLCEKDLYGTGSFQLPRPNNQRPVDPDYYYKLPCFKALSKESQDFLNAKAKTLSTNDHEKFEVLHQFTTMLQDPDIGFPFIKAYLTPSLEMLCGSNKRTMSALVGLANLRNDDKRRQVVAVLNPRLVKGCRGPFDVMTLMTDLGFIKDASQRTNTVHYITTYFAEFFNVKDDIYSCDVHNTLGLMADFPPQWFERDPTPFLTPLLTRHCQTAYERTKLVHAFFKAQDTQGSNPLDYLTVYLVQTCLNLVPPQYGTDALVNLIGYIHNAVPNIHNAINLCDALAIERDLPLYPISTIRSTGKNQQ